MGNSVVLPPRSTFDIRHIDTWNQDHEEVRQLIAQNSLIQRLDGQPLYVCANLLYTLYPSEPAFHWNTNDPDLPWSGILDCVLRFMLSMGDLQGPIQGLRT